MTLFYAVPYTSLDTGALVYGFKVRTLRGTVVYQGFPFDTEAAAQEAGDKLAQAYTAESRVRAAR